jgi:hypothetical protein
VLEALGQFFERQLSDFAGLKLEDGDHASRVQSTQRETGGSSLGKMAAGALQRLGMPQYREFAH